MTQRREAWGWRDRRTGKRTSMSAAPTRESAQLQLDDWLERDRRGGRPDLHELMPYIEVYRLGPDDD